MKRIGVHNSELITENRRDLGPNDRAHMGQGVPGIDDDEIRYLHTIPNDLTDQEIRYIRRRVNGLIKNMRRKYKALSKMHGDVRTSDGTLNLDQRSLTYRFERYQDGKWKPEAIIEVDLNLKKPRKKSELAKLGLEKDPETPHRVVVLNGRITRPGEKNFVAINDLEIETVPGTGNIIFDALVQNGFVLYGNTLQNYVPLFDANDVLPPLGRIERRKQERLPLRELNKDQRAFVRQKAQLFRKNFKNRYSHIFDETKIDVDTTTQTFTISLTASKLFSGTNNPEINIQGTFDLVWRNQGKGGTSLNFNVQSGFTPDFDRSLGLPDPLNIVKQKRPQSAVKLFDMLALSGRVGISNDAAARAEKKALRSSKIPADVRRQGHRKDRRDGKDMCRGILRFRR